MQLPRQFQGIQGDKTATIFEGLRGRKVSKDSFIKYGDKNFITQGFSNLYLTNSKNGSKLDQLAYGLSLDYTGNQDSEAITEQDIIDVMLNYPSKSDILNYYSNNYTKKSELKKQRQYALESGLIDYCESYNVYENAIEFYFSGTEKPFTYFDCNNIENKIATEMARKDAKNNKKQTEIQFKKTFNSELLKAKIKMRKNAKKQTIINNPKATKLDYYLLPDELRPSKTAIEELFRKKRKPATKKVVAKKTETKKPATKKPVSQKVVAKKTETKKPATKKTATQKVVVKKPKTPRKLTAQNKKIAKLGNAYNEAFYNSLAGKKLTEAEIRTARQKAKTIVRRLK